MIAVGFKYKGSPARDMIRSVYMRYLVYLLLFSLLPMVDLAAHVGGLIGGFGVAYLAGRPQHPGSAIERLWQVPAGLAVTFPFVVLVVPHGDLKQAMMKLRTLALALTFTFGALAEAKTKFPKTKSSVHKVRVKKPKRPKPPKAPKRPARKTGKH
jgi:hypothetical protein